MAFTKIKGLSTDEFYELNMLIGMRKEIYTLVRFQPDTLKKDDAVWKGANALLTHINEEIFELLKKEKE